MPEEPTSASRELWGEGLAAELAGKVSSLGRRLESGLRRLRYAGASYDRRILEGAVDRPFYGYCIYVAAKLADALDYDRLSVMEFGVGDGSGLDSIEDHVEQIETIFDPTFEIYGFDTGDGPPPPESYKDMPHAYEDTYTSEAYEGYAISSWGSRADLVLGDVEETVPNFFKEHDAAPVGCAFFDMNLYSSTEAGLRLFEAEAENLLPRVICHFDTVVSNEVFRSFNNEYVGENAAINEFNKDHDDRKIAKVKYKHPWELEPIEPQEIYQFHHFHHPDYDTPIRTSGDDPFERIHPGTRRI